MAELPSGLLEAVRNSLNITFTDDAGDVNISGIIARGMSRIDKYAGETCDYTVEDTPRELLFSYCLYARSHHIDEWEKNYSSIIAGLQIQREVARYIDENSEL